MKLQSLIVYSCEHCDKDFFTEKQCEAHEATHYGITYDDYKEWERLSIIADKAGRKTSIGKSAAATKEFARAIRELGDFEESKGLVKYECPTNWC